MFKVFKWVLCFCLIFGTIGAIISAVFLQFPVLETAAKGYVMALKEKNHSLAYKYMSTDFRDKVSYEEFVQGLIDSKLNYAVKWEAKESYFNDSKSKGVVRGIVTIKQGIREKKVPVEIRFIHVEGEFEGKSWYVQSITETRGDDP